MNSPRTRFYLDKANGRFLGVCAGIADYTGIDATWVRIGFVVLTLMGMPFTVAGYIAAAIFAPNKRSRDRFKPLGQGSGVTK